MVVDWYRLLPAYWYQYCATSPLWDEALNEALDSGISSADYYRCNVGGYSVWIQNWPYDYGGMVGGDDGRSIVGLPTVRTRLRLRAAVEDYRIRAALAKGRV